MAVSGERGAILQSSAFLTGRDIRRQDEAPALACLKPRSTNGSIARQRSAAKEQKVPSSRFVGLGLHALERVPQRSFCAAIDLGPRRTPKTR